MMNAVKKEAKQLEAVKQKLREMDGMQSTINELRGKLAAAENMNTELKESCSSSSPLRLVTVSLEIPSIIERARAAASRSSPKMYS